MRLPQLSVPVVLGGGLLVVAGLGGALAVVLTGGSPGSTALEQVTATPTPEVTPTVTPTPTQEPTATPSATPSPTASPTPSPTHVAIVRSPTPRPTPSPTCGLYNPCPAVPETVTVSVDGPLTVVEGKDYAYTLHVSWTKERPKHLELTFDTYSLPRNDGCDRPKTPPAGSGPGSTTLTVHQTWANPSRGHFVLGRASTGCQYYEGGDSKQYQVQVGPAPSPQPS